MNTDDVDELLHDRAGRWAESHPAPQPLDVAIHRAQAGRRSPPLRVAIAASIFLVAAIAAIPLARSWTSTHIATTSPHTTSPSAETRAKLAQSARIVGAANGDSQVAAEAVLTTYLAAVRAVLGGDTSRDLADGTLVWVIQVHGDFGCIHCSLPRFGGAPPPLTPKGHVITLIEDVTTLQPHDFSLTDRSHDLSASERSSDSPHKTSSPTVAVNCPPDARVRRGSHCRLSAEG